MSERAFVIADGENLVLRYQELLRTGREADAHTVHETDLLVWLPKITMAIFVGSLCALAPQQTKSIGPVAVQALIAATLACLMTGCVAGTLFTEGSILLGGS